MSNEENKVEVGISADIVLVDKANTLSEKEQTIFNLIKEKKQISFADILAMENGASLAGAVGKLKQLNLVDILKVSISGQPNTPTIRVVRLK